jgi:tetratricopeptide (TPR) repeat protein
VVESLFPGPRPPRRAGTHDELLLSRSGMDTHELVQRIRRPSVDNTTLDALSLTVEQLCCDYASRDAAELIGESRRWLSQITQLLDERLTLNQHHDVLDAAGWLTLLVGCLEHDTGQGRQAEATRTGALRLGEDARNPSLIGWAHELRSWFAITGGRYPEVINAAQAGQDAAPGRSVSVQLLAQEAKAWARTGNQRNVIKALEKGRTLLDSLPYPERPDNHFVVDPDKFDFYAMDCYRLIGDDDLAEMHAREIIRKTTAPDGTNLSPMRKAEAEITLGVISARNGALDEAMAYGQQALAIDRRSQPSLLMVGSELDHALQENFPNDPAVQDFHHALISSTRLSA